MRRKSQQQKKLTRLLLMWAAVALIGTTAHLTGAFSAADRVILDRKFLLFEREYEGDDIALIAIDESSLVRFSREYNLQWPWPRELYGILTDYLHEAGARTITYDILFDRPDIDRIDTAGPASDQRFSDAIKNSGRVILAANSTFSDTVSTPPDSFFKPPDSLYRSPDSFYSHRDALFTFHQDEEVDLQRHFLKIDGHHPKLPQVRPANIPIPPLYKSAQQIGNVIMQISPDGVIRNTYLMLPVASADGSSNTGRACYYPSLPLAIYLSSVMDENAGFKKIRLSEAVLQFDNLSIPLQSDGTYRINWYSRGGTGNGTFPYYSFYDAFLTVMADLMNRPEQATLDSSIFKDRHILIGASAPGLADIKITPFSSIEPYPGMEIQATMLANLLDGSFLIEMSEALILAILWLLLLSMILGIGLLRHYKSMVLAIAAPLAVVTAGFILFALFRFVMPTALFTGMTVLGIVTTYIYRYLTEERQKKEIKSAFSQYVQKEIVDRIAEDPEQLKLGGQQKELTVLFSDMVNFTSIAEKLSPVELAQFLNDYLTDMTRIVFKHGGTLDKFIGDAVMAFWGAPVDQYDHALRACRCALEMQRRLDEHSQEWQEMGYPPVYIRIGINTGPMVVGNMGSSDRFNYSVVGDAVNLGARLEPLNKEYGTRLMISEFTLKAIQYLFDKQNDGSSGEKKAESLKVRELGRITVKGKSNAVTVYELIDIPGQ